MSKKFNEKVFYVVTFIAVFIVPTLLLHYFGSEDKDFFYEKINENHQICLERAERDAARTRWCDEIKTASVDTFNSTKNFNDLRMLMMIFQPVLFVLLIGIGSLRKQVESLKEKIGE